MPRRHPPTADWRAPANADLLKHGAASADAPAGEASSLAEVSWWNRLPQRMTRLAVLAVAALVAAVYMTGGVDATVSALLRKESLHGLPGGASVRRFVLDIAGRRSARPEVLQQLARMAHVVDPGDPLWSNVVQTAATLLARPLTAGTPAATLSALDAAVAEAVNRPLAADGILGWREIDPYFVVAIEEIAGTDTAAAAHRFNSIRTPDGLPTGEWYLDELVRGFGDQRPISFVLVADSTGDDWRPMALPPDQVPAHARRIRASTVGEALRVGLWGLDDYRPETPDVDVGAWWTALAGPRGLPTYDLRP